MQKILLTLLKSLLGNAINEETLAQFAEYLRRMLYRGVDVLIAAALAFAIQWFNAPANPDDVILAMGLPLGNANIDPTTNVVGSFALVTLLRYVAPILLKLLGTWFFPALVLLFVLAISGQSHATEIQGSMNSITGKPPIIRLQAKVESDSRCFWLVFPMDNIDMETNGNECQIVGIPGSSHTIVLVELRKEGVNPAQSQVQGTISFGTTPNPNPNPNPTPPHPNPNPTIPDGAFGLTKWAYAEVANMPHSDKAYAPSVANFFKQASEDLKASRPIRVVITDKVQEFPSNPTGFQQAITAYIDPLGAQWGAFKAKLGGELRKPAFTKTPADYIAAGMAVSDGIALVK